MRTFIFLLLSVPCVCAEICVDSDCLIQPDWDNLYLERAKSAVLVEYTFEDEIREPNKCVAAGILVNDEGHVLIGDVNFVGRLTPYAHLKNFKVYVLGRKNKSYQARYLGKIPVSNFHCVQIEDEDFRNELIPVTQWPVAEADLLGGVWSILILSKNFSYKPLFISSGVAGKFFHYHREAHIVGGLGGSGSPVFDFQGNFLGVAIGQGAESSQYLYAEDFLSTLSQIPDSVESQVFPFWGAANAHVLDGDLREHYGFLDAIGAVILGTIVEDGPANQAGLVDGDIVIGLDGDFLPDYEDYNLATLDYLQKTLIQKRPGDAVELVYVSSDNHFDSRQQTTLVLGKEPKSARNAERAFFKKLGFVACDWSFDDNLRFNRFNLDINGISACLVLNNSKIHSAGMIPGDKIIEIDGALVDDYSQAVSLLQDLEDNIEDKKTASVVIERMTSNGSHTAVLNVRLPKPQKALAP